MIRICVLAGQNKAHHVVIGGGGDLENNIMKEHGYQCFFSVTSFRAHSTNPGIRSIT